MSIPDTYQRGPDAIDLKAMTTFEKEGKVMQLPHINHMVIAKVNALQLEENTHLIYDTHGGLDKQGKLVDRNKEWSLKDSDKARWYINRLFNIAHDHKIARADALMLDQSLRMKRARGYDNCFIWAAPLLPEHEYLLHHSLFGPAIEFQRVDCNLVCYSYLISDSTLVRRCQHCQFTGKLYRCSCCRKVFYCSQLCQVQASMKPDYTCRKHTNTNK